MKVKTKKTIRNVVIFVLVVAVILYFYNPNFKYETDTLFSDIENKVSNVGGSSSSETISLTELVENKDKYLGKNITTKGNVQIIFWALIEVPEGRIKEELYIEDKVTVPSSRVSIPIKIEGYLNYGYWSCSGTLKNFNNIYYFDASFCNCIKDC